MSLRCTVNTCKGIYDIIIEKQPVTVESVYHTLQEKGIYLNLPHRTAKQMINKQLRCLTVYGNLRQNTNNNNDITWSINDTKGIINEYNQRKYG